MTNKTFLFVIVVFSLSLATVSNAQEVLVPIDAEGKLEFIDAKLEKELGLFPEYRNFQDARLFQISDTSFVLEIHYQPEERVLKVRLPLSTKEVSEFRWKVTRRIREEKPRVVLDQEGRTKLLAGTLTLSLGYYGWALPYTLDVDDSKSFLAIYMLTSGAGFFIPLSLTKDMRVTDAAATLSLYGGTRGILHGMSLYELFGGEDESERGLVGLGMLGSISEAVVFFHIANKSNMSSGTADVISTGGDFGIGWGLGTAHLAGFFDDEEERSIFGSILLGSGAGLLAGKYLAGNQPYTRGDAYVLGGAGFLGAYIPVALVDIADPDDGKVYTAAAMLGSVFGLGLGDRLVRGKDFSTGQGRLITLGEMAGGLIGLGVAYIVSSEDENSALYLNSIALGATAGFWLMYRSFAKDARSYEQSSSWNIQLAPEGLLVYGMSKRSSTSLKRAIPLAKLEFKF